MHYVIGKSHFHKKCHTDGFCMEPLTLDFIKEHQLDKKKLTLYTQKQQDVHHHYIKFTGIGNNPYNERNCVTWILFVWLSLTSVSTLSPI